MKKKIVGFLTEKWQLQPLLLAIYILLVNIDDFGASYVKWSELLLVFITIVAFWFLVFFVSKFFFKDSFKNSYISTFVVFTAMFYNTLYFASWVRARHMILIITLLFVAIIIFSIRDKQKLRPPRKKIILFLNTFFLIIVIQVLIKASRLFDKIPVKPEISIDLKKSKTSNPDLYLFILDGYANQKSLEKYWGFNDSSLTNNLSNLGFYLVKNSKSSYYFTVQTISSMFDLDYLANGEKQNERKLIRKIRQNTTVGSLQKSGYDIFNYSLFEIGKNTTNYKKKGFQSIPNFYFFVFSKSAFYFIADLAKMDVAMDNNESEYVDLPTKINQEGNILDTLSVLINSKTKAPKFVYYHSMVTHAPFYLDKEGNVSKEIENENTKINLLEWIENQNDYQSMGSALKDSFWMTNYLNAVKYSNKSVLHLVKNILDSASNERKPIIIVMSDHGFRFLLHRPFSEVNAERYSNFCAVYFPDHDYSSLYDSMTPVNIMRSVLNKAISSQLKYVPDKSGLSENHSLTKFFH